MNKRVFIVHGWDGTPYQHWLPWLKNELELKGFSVEVPTMPESEHPRREAWVKHLSDLVGAPDENTYFVGHSIGCKAILLYLETLNKEDVVGGAVFVAGWVKLTNMGERTSEELEVIEDWIHKPFDFKKIRNHCSKFTAIFSDDDPEVPLEENKDTYERELGAKIIIEHNKGHFTADDGVTELPSALNALLAD